MEESYKDSKMFFKKSNEIRKPYKPKSSIIKNEYNELITDKQAIAEEFKRFFQEMLNQPEIEDQGQDNDVFTTVEQYQCIPGKEEIKEAIEMLKNNKAPGKDMIAAELIKNGGELIVNDMWELIKKIRQKEQIPEEWKVAVICPIYKKGDPEDCHNYRGISLLNAAYKILSNVILNRLKPYTKEIVGEYQCGFKPGKSTVDHVFTLRQLIEKHYEYNKPLQLLFIDFKQAYDSIKRKLLWKSMEKFGIPLKLVKMVKTCIEESRCKIKFVSNYSEEFETKVGLKQGYALSPILFNVALEEVVRKVQEKANGVIFNGQMHAVLAYADEIVILGSNEEDIKTTTEQLITRAMNMGLMIVQRGNQLHQNRSLNIENYCFEKVENFKYLGVDINSQNNYHEEINLRVKAGDRCYFALQKTFRSKILSKK